MKRPAVGVGAMPRRRAAAPAFPFASPVPRRSAAWGRPNVLPTRGLMSVARAREMVARSGLPVRLASAGHPVTAVPLGSERVT
jgi:hypothetical protein